MSDSDESHHAVSPPKKRRKGVKSKEYQQDIIRNARVKNQPYVNYKGNQCNAKSHTEGCRCRQKCTDHLSENETMDLYTNFISYDTKNEQDAYLQSLISIRPIARRRPRLNPDVTDDEIDLKKKTKGVGFIYTLSLQSGRREVCKTAFVNVHGITTERVRRICNLLACGKSPKDARGKQRSGNAKPFSKIKLIEDHINSFPVKTAHYNNEYKYLSSKLNLKIMWELFRKSHTDVDDITYHYYSKIFRESFNLKFGKPQIDTCCQCEQLSVKIKSPSLNETAKRVAAAELLVHKRRANKFYKKIKEMTEKSKSQDNIAVLSMDYMQNLQLPEIPVQETFYLRQLTVNVFNIHDCKTEKGMFYVYHEGIARKGPNEVCSNLVHYLKNKLDEKIRHLHLFSDGCGGQNKNHCLVRVMLMLIATGRFDSITHYFPQRGHSYLPSDRDFHVVKSKLRKIDRIYTVNEYKDLIIESSAKNRFEVQLVSSGDILDYKTWWPNFYRKNVISKETSGRTTPRQMKKSFSISEFSEFKYSKEHIGSVQVKKYIDGLETHTFVLANACVIPSEPHGAYSEDCVPINIKKMDDIKKFKTYLPETEEVKNFYDIIFSIPVIEQNDD